MRPGRKQGKKQSAQPPAPLPGLPPEPPLAPVAVITITFSPPLNQVIAIDPNFPRRMRLDDMLYILRRAEESLITRMALEVRGTPAPAPAENSDAATANRTG